MSESARAFDGDAGLLKADVATAPAGAVPLSRAAEPAAVLYAMRVMHRRHVAPLYRFVYRIFSVLFDVDRLAELGKGRRWFGHNRFNLLSFFDRDHGYGDAPPAGIAGNPLRRWAEDLCARRGIELAGGRIRLLAQPRMFGFAFNPISLWYCEHADGALRAVIAEVRNTFGEKHAYVIAPADAAVLRAADGIGEPPSGSLPTASASTREVLPYDTELVKEKRFHVSPLFDLEGHYHFRFGEPGQRLRVVINERRRGAPLLDAIMAGEARALTDGEILRQVVRMPVQAVKVLVGIHWQALKIWLRGARFHPKPAAPATDHS